MKIQPTIFWIALASLALGLFLLPAGASAAPLVYIQLLARQDGTDNPFSSTITPTAVGEEYDWIVVATLAPAGTQNTNLPVDANGKQQIGSWQVGDGLGGTQYALFENSSAPTQVSFQNPGFMGATNTGGHAGIDPSISNGLTTSLTNAGNFGNASYSGGVNTIAYQYTGQAPGTTQTLTPTGISQAPAGNALWQNFAAGTGTSGGTIAARATGSSSNDLVFTTAIAGANYYTGVDDGTVNTSGTNQSPVTMILESGSHDYYNTATGNGAKVDSTFVVTGLGGGSSTLSINSFDLNPGNPGGAPSPEYAILNLQYHDTAGTLQKPGPAGSLQYSSQTSTDPIIQYTGLTIVGGPTDAVLAFDPTTASFGRVLVNSTPTLDANLNNSSSAFRTAFSATFSNGISGSTSAFATPGGNIVPIQLQNNAAGSGTLGNNSWTYTVTNTGNTADTSPTGKTLTVSANVVAPRAFNSNAVNVSGTIGDTGGLISIPFSFTSTGDFATTTSVAVNAGGGTLASNGFSTSGSYTFNGGQATIGNVTFNSATDTYTANGTITGTLNPGQTVTGSFNLPVTTLETGLGDTYAPVVVNFTANSTPPPGTSVLAFNPTTLNFGRVLLNSTPSINATLTNTPANGTDLATFSAAASNDGISGPTTGCVPGGSPGTTPIAIQLQDNANGTGAVGNNSWTYTVSNTRNTGDTSPAGKTLTVLADVVARRTFNIVSVSGTLGPAGGVISIPFSFTSTGDFATTTSVEVNASGGTLTDNGFSTTGSYIFNGGQATIGNVVFDASTDTYTASGTITGTLTSGQTVTGSIALPVTTLETGLGDTYARIVVNFTAAAANSSVLSFTPTTASFGRVLLNSTPSINATLNNSGTVAGNFTGVTSNNGISAPASGSAAPGANTVAIQLQNNANGSGTVGNNSWTYTVTNTSATGDTSAAGKTLTVSADVVALRTFTGASVSGSIGSGGGPISIPFSFTSTGDFATTTSVAVNAGGGSLTSNGFSTSGSYTFNGGQATIGNVTFNAATDTYTASGTITGTLNPGQSVAGSFSLPITTLETGLGDTYAPVVVNFLASAAGPGGNNSVLEFSPTTVIFGRVLLHSTRGVDAALTNAGINAGTYTGVTSNNGISASASGSIAAGPGLTETVPITLQNNANGTGTVGNNSWTYTVTNTSDAGDTIAAGKTLTVSADVVVERSFFSASARLPASPLSNSNLITVSGTSATAGGMISIPFIFTSTGDLATTTSVTVHGASEGSFGVSGSFVFNGSAASSSNVTFNAATDTYTAEGFITGNLPAGQTTSGTITMQVTTNEAGLGDSYAPIDVSYTATAPAAATADTSNLSGVFGTVISKVILAGATYAGVGTTVTQGNGAVSPVNGSTGGPIEHSTAIILAGTNTGANPVAVTMAWRTRTRGETPTSQGGTPISPPLPAGPVPLVSDVMQLTRTDAVIGSTPTSPYALEMNYDPSTLGSATAQGVEVSQNQLYLGWLDPNGSGPDVAGWDNAILGNTGDNAAAAEQGFLGSFAAFQAANGTNLASYIGAWGVDPTGDDAWAVLDHSSTFGVIGGPELMPVPEPSAALLAALGLAGLGCRRLKRRRGPECRSSRK